ncbi:hypothetical protein CDL15_Pgr019181 [Punica granatum]|uniref:Uncharacterized protein n=1 Tax=Punica granatum TaxID=22663 RepID=A0A218W5W5_PUNGR|nr:hypothetical protein CDL15_Pgr019181 [Punica granatum]
MGSSSSPSSKDEEADDPNYCSRSSPRNLFQEAVIAILRCLGFERENMTSQQVGSGLSGSAEKESEGKERESSSPLQPKEEGDQGKGDDGGGAASVSLVEYDPQSEEVGDPPAAGAEDDPPFVAQVYI